MTNREQDIPKRQAGSSGAQMSPAASLTRVAIRRPPASDDTSARNDDPPRVHRLFDDGPVIDVVPVRETDVSRENADTAAPSSGVPKGHAPDYAAYVAPAALTDLWEHLAEHRLRPRRADIDPVAIARQWPNSLMLRVTEQGCRPGLEVAHMFAPSAEAPASAIPIDAMTVDWIVGLGREVVITGGPVHETDLVPTGGGPIRCGVIALPFGPDACVDHVLCHLYRVDPNTLEAGTDTGHSLPPRDRTGIRRIFGRWPAARFLFSGLAVRPCYDADMNRAALLVIAALTGAGAAYTIYLSVTGDAEITAWRAARATAAVLVIGAAIVTWRELIRPTARQAHVLKRAALVALIVGVIGLGANAFIGGTTNVPDGPVFVLSLLLILQAFLTIGHASRTT